MNLDIDLITRAVAIAQFGIAILNLFCRARNH